MASPQVGDGFLQIANELWEAIARQDLSGQEFRVLIAVIRKTYGFKKKQDWLTNRCLAMVTGLHTHSVSRAITRLAARNIIRVNQNVDGHKRIISINKDYDTWRGLTDSSGVNQNRERGLTKTANGGKPIPEGHLIKETLTKETLTKDKAREYYTEKLGHELGAKMESVIYDFKNTRKTKKLAPAVLIRIVDYWLKFSSQSLLEAKSVWDEQRYAHEGKDEKYFNGILRRLAKEVEIRRASQVGAHR